MQLKFNNQNLAGVSKLAQVFAADILDCLNQESGKAKKMQLVIYLCGELGSGKTAWTREFIKALGFAGKVKSPTYTIVETYKINNINVAHLDLYRLKSSGDFLDSGLSEYIGENFITLIEWPEIAQNIIGEPNIQINFAYNLKIKCDDERNLSLTFFNNSFNLISKNIFQSLNP